MSRYIQFSREEKEQARTTDLVQFLTVQGEEVKKSGSEYVWMDGGQKVTIRGNLWFHQYEQKGGDSIDFVRKFYHKGYSDAVQMLLGGHAGTEISHSYQPPKREKPFVLPAKNDNMRRMFAYLLFTRGLDKSVVQEFVSQNYSLNIKDKTVVQGQHGTARWATKSEVVRTYKHVPFTPQAWRNGENLPKEQGIVVGCKSKGKKTIAMVDTGDVHAVMVGAAGVGKTAYWLYPCIEYACATGMSFLSSDTKGDVVKNYGTIAEKYYGYNVSVIDLRNPTRSTGLK